MRRCALPALVALLVACGAPAPARSTADEKRVEEFFAQVDTALPAEGAPTPATDGPVRILWPGGALAAEGTMRDGRREGLWRRYWLHGALLEEGRYEADRPVGEWLAWWRTGGPPDAEELTENECDGEGLLPLLEADGECGTDLLEHHAHHPEMQQLRRCIGPWRERLRQTLADEHRSLWVGRTIGRAESAEALIAVREEMERALDAVLADPAAFHEEWGVRSTLEGGGHALELRMFSFAGDADLSLRHRVLRDLERSAGADLSEIYDPIIVPALDHRPGFDAALLRTLDGLRARSTTSEARRSLDHYERRVLAAVARRDPRTALALSRRALGTEARERTGL